MKYYGITFLFAFILFIPVKAQLVGPEETTRQATNALNVEQDMENERQTRIGAGKKDVEKANKKRYKKVYRKRGKEVRKPEIKSEKTRKKLSFRVN